jgi:hypothetical protein
LKVCYHWTNTDNMLNIIKTGVWWGGSATLDVTYKFEKGEGLHDAPDQCLIFDSSDFEERVEIIMGASPLGPFLLEEAEVFFEGKIRLDDKRFIGLGARTEENCQWLREVTSCRFHVQLLPKSRPGLRCDNHDCGNKYGHDGPCPS